MKSVKYLLFVSLSIVSALSACGRSDSDIYSAYNLTSKSDLGAENRLALQSNSGTYLYVPPEPATLEDPDSIDLVITPKASKATVSSPEQQSKPKPLTESDPRPTTRPISPPTYRQAPVFELEDLKGQRQSFTYPLPKVTLMAFADQDGAKQMEAWITPLYQHYTDQIDIHGVAVLSMVPAFARGIARGIISTQVKQPIMLDWTGDVSKQFQTLPKVTHLFVLNQQGQILIEQSGSVSSEKLALIAEAIEQALK